MEQNPEKKPVNDIRAIRVQIERMQSTLATIDLSLPTLYGLTSEGLDSIIARFQNDEASANFLQSTLNGTQQEYQQLSAIRKKLHEQVENLLAFKPNYDKLIITIQSDSKNLVDETTAIHYYLRDKETMEDAYYDRDIPYEFYLNHMNTLYYQLRKDHALSLYDHQLQEVIAYHIFNPEGKNVKTIGLLAQNAKEAEAKELPYHIYGSPRQALEMGKKIYRYVPAYRKADLKIYLNDALTDSVKLVVAYDLGFFMKRYFRTGRAFLVESPNDY